MRRGGRVRIYFLWKKGRTECHGRRGKKKNGSKKLKRKEKEIEQASGRTLSSAGMGQSKGPALIIVFEGRDTAGKGGTIKAITERVSPRVFRVMALPAPSDREKTQMFIQRYIQHFPAAGEIVIFDRSWYNRAGVERVMGFVDDRDTRHFLDCARKSRNTSSTAASR